MRFAGINRLCGAAILGIATFGPQAQAQSRSAVLRVSANVVDVGAVTPVPFEAVRASTSGAPMLATAPGGRRAGVFSVVPPRNSAVAVSVAVSHAGPDDGRDVAIQVCRPSDPGPAPCRRVPFTSLRDDSQIAAVTEQAIVVHLTGLTDVLADTALVTLTLAYPGN
jgi:hypothetical protein